MGKDTGKLSQRVSALKKRVLINDLDVISASFNSKSTLRAVADEFCARHDNVFYFPAYEMATIYQPLNGQFHFSDGRENYHVNKATVKFIMRHFFEYYSR